nr:hypothetical protein [Tanacetum cinerariifolium]
MDEALVPHAQRLRIGRSNFRLLSDIKSKESTLQLVYDVLHMCPFFKAFLVTSDVPEIYMQEFWVTATVHHHAIRFKMDNKKHVVNLESFRDILHICPRVEHKNSKKSNEMYYPRFTKVIIHHSMSKDSSIPRRNKVNWHYVRDDHMFYTIKLVSRHQNTQQFGALLPIELTNEEIRNSNAYKEYYAIATGAAPPNPKASVRRTRSSSDTTITPPTAAAGPRLTISQKGKQAAKVSKAKSLSALSEDGDGDEEDDGKEGNGDDDDEDDDGEEGDDDDDHHHEVVRDDDKDDEKDDEEEGNKSIQRSDEQRNLYKALVEAYESDKIILDTYGETVSLKRRRDDDADKDEEPSVGPDRGSKRRREGKEPESASAHTETATRSAGRSTQGSQSRQVSTSESDFTEDPMQTTFQMEEPSHPEFDTGTEDQPIVQSSQHPEWFSLKQKPPSMDHDWNKTMPATHGSIQPWISELTKLSDSRSSFNELMDTSLDFSNFLINRLKVDTLTPELLAGPTYELMNGSCKSLVEIEYHLEEVFKATTDQLDWVNPRDHQYPHNLLKPLPLVPNNRGRRVILFEHFINNDLEYLRVCALSRKYTTSITKTKGVSHWGRKRQQFYDFVVNRESARDVYSKRRIIAVTELKIVEWHNYKYLDWITVRRDDDKLYKFKKVEERFAFNVSLRMFTRSIVIQRRVEDLQLGVESYQKKLNLTKPDTYRSSLKRKEAYIAYSNPRGFIYQNKDKKNRLMRIDKLHKFSDGMLTDVRTALDDRLKGIRMQYFPQSIWRKSDKDRAAAMIQAIDKRLKTRRSLERFDGRRLYEGDFRMLQRTI